MSESKRVIVLTDISSMNAYEGEPDDTQSLIRFLLYANEFDIEGLIATYTGHGQRCNPQFIREVVEAYGEALPNLRRHDARYPSAEELLPKIRRGSDVIGLNTVGLNGDTEASGLIISAADKADDRPLWILIWGGPRELAQAVWNVCHTRSSEEAKRFKEKLRVYSISDQYDTTGQWIKAEHPDIFYITAGITFRGMYRGGDTSYCEPEWIREHICRGPLGKKYPVYDGGDPWGSVKGLKEGDTPSFLYLLGRGADSTEDPATESWGGQFVRRGRQFYDLPDSEEAMKSVYMWRNEFQQDFAQRIGWTLE